MALSLRLYGARMVCCRGRALFSTTLSAPPDSLAETGTQAVTPVRSQAPHILGRELRFPPQFRAARQAWVENLDTVEEERLGLIDLHPEVFGVFPRIDLVHQNVRWQQMYRYVSFAEAKTRAEMRGGGRKPWPQKGTGRARHGSIRSPLWIGGGKAHGARQPKTGFYMLPLDSRVHGLLSTLSIKFAQDDLHVVNSLEIPTDDAKFLEELVEKRHWGVSVLFVDDTDLMPRNITAATSSIKHYNLMPTYGLNVWSMLKHETLVLTYAAVEKLEEKLLQQVHRSDGKMKKFELGKV